MRPVVGSISPATTPERGFPGTGRSPRSHPPSALALESACGEIAEEHRRLWLERNRPGGLTESVAWLEHLEDCYSTGQADQGWFGPLG